MNNYYNNNLNNQFKGGFPMNQNLNVNNNFNNNIGNNQFQFDQMKNIKDNPLNPKTMYYGYSNNNNIQSNKEEAKKMEEKMRKEKELESQIRDHLKCYICLSKVNKPKMCKFCKKICCESCINKWLQNKKFCGICKHQLTEQDMITLPFLDDMSSYFINNIDNHPKNQPYDYKINHSKPLINKNKNIQKYNSVDYNKINNMNIDEQNKYFCSKHRSKNDYYCIQCNKYYCSNCLVFFGEEVKKHQGHIIIQITKMNDLGIKKAIEEYNKLPKTKDVIENLIRLCNLKLKENEIKKSEIQNFMNLIRDLYLNKIDETSQDIKNILSDLQNKKEQIENKISSIPNGFNNIINSNDYAQGSVVSNELKKFNSINGNLENEIIEKSKISPKLFIENYETDYIEFDLPFSGQYSEGYEIVNKKLNFIPGFPSTILLKYLQNQVFISFSVDINFPLNAFNYPKFYTYITFKNKNYGLDFYNLSNQSFPQDFIQQRGNNERMIRQQINSFGINAQSFVNMFGNDKKIKMKIFIIKTHYD